ncbi:nicotinate-nucleotide pyrophosphorylase (carboxylating) [Chthonomonas calidirosea]|uniref:Probable nicotinate-nucleotide pyrophosphorylase [carboxylating] n=1 Tax=Chthonomonas calidirosea (strain DSM 23976 / ICMP 18418 / T49) TaxID=1303518 RepID=S0EXL8_CHTCT|nr:carboxylating nicotinate-nucleotide diphosphorylase [Chthonomonas calidirosea]CCW34543.1 nicotinate-nucleotide pyrophosphorylase [carboxylating] [Chthonomonas calidirosea T49]CEK13244.1 nicotinate-nucleotide pyrophosphorylase (carboxylating) [Chthonomonas calidirosea]CEK13245.1 nicotinate-nucleotide pyrophosphorylase (carboxylating) [Chthonomonas calidirosea]CEK14483.1 nicotinate-nucleotide pyrophosphorylase (carboxylating) [Chthonomonas calidirosea]
MNAFSTNPKSAPSYTVFRDLPGLTSIVQQALREDIGTGDITTQIVIPSTARAKANITTRVPGVIAGLPVVQEVYRQLDPTVQVQPIVQDGDSVEANTPLATLSGSAQSLLTGERVALNFLQRLSGIATLTAKFVAAARREDVRIVDTRKTTPGLRLLEKYAVRVGGGHNHRFGLYDAVLIKDNHIAACGSITEAVRTALSSAPHVMSVTVECDTLDQVREALAAGADVILLDNMSPDQLREAVSLVNGQAMIEASGGITLENVAEVAATGVDIISIGALTHSAPALDIGMDFIVTSL